MDEGGQEGGRDEGRKKERFLNRHSIILPASITLKKKKKGKQTKKKERNLIVLSLFFFVKFNIMKVYAFITENINVRS